jgi:hypothetical protein
VIKLPAIVVTHSKILPDHTTKVDLLMNSLVRPPSQPVSK